MMLRLVLVAAGGITAAAVPGTDVSQEVPYFSQSMVHVEAESFTPTVGSAWSPKKWGDDGGFFASTVANTFHSRRGYLHAPANSSTETVATAAITVPAAGSYTVLARYEQGYRFTMPFRLDIATTSAPTTPVFTREYGHRESLKVQAFGGCPTAVGQPAGRGQLQAECSWPYGTTENVVWEGVGSAASLAAGSYVMTLTALNTTLPGVVDGAGMQAVHFCDRNVDAFVLTPNATDVTMRLAHEQPFLPLDGLFSQAGEVYFKVENTGDETFNLTVPYTYIHSPYFGMHLTMPVGSPTAPTSGCGRSGGPLCPVISTPAMQTSEWVDVGAQMDTFNHGTWNLPFGPYVLHVGVRSGGTAAAPVVTQIGEFEAPGDSFGLQLVFDESTRETKRIRTQGSDFWELYEALTNQTTNIGPEAPNQIAPFTKGAVPTHVPIVAGFWDAVTPAGGGNKSPVCPKCGAEYTKAQAAMQDMFGITTYSMPACSDSLPTGTVCTTDKQYIDIRGCISSPDAIEKCLQVYVNASTTNAILVVSLGDEIGVVDPNPNKTAPDKFEAWCNAQGHAGKPGCGGVVDTTIASAKGDATSNGHYYYSLRFVHDTGIARYKALTDKIRSILPRALVGANYSPTGYAIGPADGQQYCHAYLGIVYQWIELFRKGGMTMPWSEDWAWQTPMASQQVTGLMVDALRAGVTTYSSFDEALPYGDGTVPLTPVAKPFEVPELVPYGGSAPMLMYVMAHSPGNNPIMWKRQLFQDIAHGVKIFDLFDFESSISGYTCDYVDPDFGSYEMVRQSLNELGMFDDIVWDGVAQAAGAKVAIMYSDSADAWMSPEITSQGSAKRTLYTMLKHMGLPTDIVTEDDCTAGYLNHYGALYVVDAQISEAAATAIGAWATAGGQVFMTAGAGLLNEYNLTNAAMAALLPVTQSGTWTGTVDSGRNATIFYAQQDLAYAEKLDEVTVLAQPNLDAYSLDVFGDKSIFTFAPKPTDEAHVLGVFSDDTPAVVNISLGAHGGGITYAGFHLGLSYFHPAMPIRPVDRTPSIKSLTNFVPTDFNTHAKLLAEVALHAPATADARPVLCDNPLVEVGFVSRTATGGIWNGTALPLIDWSATTGNSSGNGYTRVNITLNPLPGAAQHPAAITYTTASLASCGATARSACRGVIPPSCDVAPCNVSRPGYLRLNVSENNMSFSIDLNIADALILR